MTQEAGATPSGDEKSSPIDLSSLRKEVAVYIAHRLSLSLFQADAKDRLRVEITRLTNERLEIKHLHLDEQTHARLVDDLIAGIPTKSPSIPEARAATDLKDTIRTEIVSSLARVLTDRLLEPGQEASLAAAISRVVRAKVDSLPPAQKSQISYKDLLTIVLTGINPKLTSYIKEEETPPPAPEVKPEPAAPVSDKKESEAVAAVEKAERVAEKETQDKEEPAEPEGLNQDELRALLFEIAGRMDFDAVERKDRNALALKIDEVLKEHPNVELSTEVKEQLIDGILSGGAVEFQL